MREIVTGRVARPARITLEIPGKPASGGADTAKAEGKLAHRSECQAGPEDSEWIIIAQWCLPLRRQHAGILAEASSANNAGAISEKLKQATSRDARARRISSIVASRAAVTLFSDSFWRSGVILFVHMDRDAFLQLFDEHHLPLFRFAYRMTGTVADAEDVVQECFLELLRPGCSYDPKRTPIRTYLFGVVRNQSLKRAGKRVLAGAQGQEAWNGLSPECEVLRTEMEGVVARAVTQLPEGQREVLVLAHYEQMPLAEIARVLEIEVTAVKSRLQRARARLKETLAAYALGMEGKR